MQEESEQLFCQAPIFQAVFTCIVYCERVILGGDTNPVVIIQNLDSLGFILSHLSAAKCPETASVKALMQHFLFRDDSGYSCIQFSL